MAVINAILPITMTSFNTAGLNGSFQVVNSGGTTEACVLIRIVNDSDQDVTVSFDGAVDHDYVRAGETLQLPIQSNAAPGSNTAKLRQGTQVWVKGAGAGTGLIYLAGYYQVQR